MKKHKLDIVISGGGLSGCLMALSLADVKKPDGSLLSIVIVEANSSEVNKSEAHSSEENKLEINKKERSQKNTPLFDDRVLALSHASAKYLEDVGAWKYLKSDATSIKSIDISDRGHYGKARLQAKEHGVLALGYVIEMALVGKALLKALSNRKNIHWHSPDTITDIDWQGNESNSRIIITLASKKRLETPLLLACDGVNSPCRKFANIDVNASDYQQVALIANVATQKAHNNKAYERFTEHGPIAMLPLKSQKVNNKNQSRCSLVWTMSPELAEEISSLNEFEFKQALEFNFGGWLGDITHVGKRDVYPLVLLQAQRQTFHRVALIGNASHTIHPIAGQGFNLGLRDVQQMASLIQEALMNEQDIGCFSVLNDYENNRVEDQKQVIQLTDSLVTLFSNNLPPLVMGRGLGLKVFNYLTPLKKALVKKTMGY